MKSLPATVRVNGRDFKIKLKAASSMPEAYGHFIPEKTRIELRKGQSEIELKDTLLHEVAHAILHTQGREYAGDVEEMFVRALASGIVGVLQDNPWLATWLASPTTSRE